LSAPVSNAIVPGDAFEHLVQLVGDGQGLGLHAVDAHGFDVVDQVVGVQRGGEGEGVGAVLRTSSVMASSAPCTDTRSASSKAYGPGA
jgi:hypothetical protein